MPKCAACLACLMFTSFAASALTQQPQAPAGPRPALPPPPTAKTGNPTPGTPQPEPPNLADRITVTGCVQMAPGKGAPSAAAATEPANDRFVLNNARKEGAVPPGTGTSSAAAAAPAASYRLEALESQLSPFVNARVEVSGEVKDSPATPVLLVEAVRKIATACQ